MHLANVHTVPMAGPGDVSQVAALFGITAPALPSGVTWPAELAPPLSPARLLDTLQDPAGALGSCGTTMSSTPAASRGGGASAASGFSSRKGFAVSACSISCANSSADICSSLSACWTCGVSVRC